MFSWFKKKQNETTDKPVLALKQDESFEAELPVDDREPGIDIYSPTWRYIEREVKEMINAKREFNDRASLDEIRTAAIRGGIKTLKDILALPKKQAESNRPGILSRHIYAGEED